MNVVVVQGALSRAPRSRTLPSGDELGRFEVTVRSADQPAESVPVVWFGVPSRAMGWQAGTEVVVRGRVRRRFFKGPGGTASRTEVVADQVLPLTQRPWVHGLVDEVVADLSDLEPPASPTASRPAAEGAAGWVGPGDVGQDGPTHRRNKMGTSHQ